MKVLLVGEGPNELGGALETLVRRLGLTDAEIDHDRVSRKTIHAHHGKGPGYFKRAVRWMLDAQEQGYDAIVLLIDEDGRSERMSQFEQAQQYVDTKIHRAFGVAIRTFDAWMLADEQALTKVLGCTVQRQPKPERIANPKRVCSELIDSSMARSDAYEKIAATIDLALLEERCSQGFAPFARRVRGLSE